MGAAEARLFAIHGAKVVLGDVLEEPLHKLADELAAAGHEAVAHPLDVTSELDWKAIVDATERQFGRLDVLVNNAGIADPAGIEDTSRERWDQVIAVNQTGTWLGIKAAAPAMRRSGAGSIINISSIYGIVGSTGSAAYHAAKGAVRVLTKQAALEYAADGLRVNSVHPGYIDTPMFRTPFEDRPEEELEAFITLSTPLGRVGTAEEIANAVLFLASDESSFMTGAEMVVDGGFTAR
jgi:NAD(P)-dependent dehydrogenase (short-subunit alcohol dehydrogenase family)